MPNGKPRIPDLAILEMFEEDFLVNDIPRDERIATKFNLTLKEVYAILNKPRFNFWIEYGVSIRSGWLTDEGRKQLEQLRNV